MISGQKIDGTTINYGGGNLMTDGADGNCLFKNISKRNSNTLLPTTSGHRKLNSHLRNIGPFDTGQCLT